MVAGMSKLMLTDKLDVLRLVWYTAPVALCLLVPFHLHYESERYAAYAASQGSMYLGWCWCAQAWACVCGRGGGGQPGGSGMLGWPEEEGKGVEEGVMQALVGRTCWGVGPRRREMGTCVWRNGVSWGSLSHLSAAALPAHPHMRACVPAGAA